MTWFRPPRLLPTVFVVLGVLILLTLGGWQVERLHWKERLIAERHAALEAPPVSPPRSLDEARGEQFRRIAAEGTLQNGKELFLAASSEGGGAGYQILTPLVMSDGRTMFVNRGFVPTELKDRTKRAAGDPSGEVKVAGLLRLPPAEKPSFFLPDNRPDLNLWFWVDLPAMARAAGVGDALPFYMDADKTPNAGGWPKGGVTRIDLPNDHLQYAITWFGLAAALVVVYVVAHRNASAGGEQR